MSKILIRNEGPNPTVVVRMRRSEDGWGVPHDRDREKSILEPGSELELDVSGDTRGGGYRIEIEEIQPNPFDAKS
jgi:hypothetical protein